MLYPTVVQLSLDFTLQPSSHAAVTSPIAPDNSEFMFLKVRIPSHDQWVQTYVLPSRLFPQIYHPLLPLLLLALTVPLLLHPIPGMLISIGLNTSRKVYLYRKRQSVEHQVLKD
jgi:hypothetical protein